MKRAILLLLIGGCTAQQAIEEEAGRPVNTVLDSTTDLTPVVDPPPDPLAFARTACSEWRTSAEVDATATYIGNDRLNGWSYADEMFIVLEVCRARCQTTSRCYTACVNCDTAIVDAVYGR